MICLVLTLLWRMRCEVQGGYDGILITLRLKLGFVSIKLLPQKEKKKKKEKQTKEKKKKVKKEEAVEPPKRSLGYYLDFAQKLFPVITKAAAQFKQKLCINLIGLHIRWSSEDAAKTAFGYGAICSAFAIMIPLLESAVEVKVREITVTPDFTKTTPDVIWQLHASMRVGQLICLSVVTIKEFLKLKKLDRIEQKENEHGTETSNQ